ncbi:MAG: SAF domain-containing protein [Gemmataceae bacterium]
MRASILISAAIALLVFLAVIIIARQTGLFEPTPAKEPPKKKEYRILVARRNLYAGTTLNSMSVGIRTASPSEARDYEKNPREFLPSLVEAAVGRILIRNVPANQPLKEAHFEELALPSSIQERLEKLGKNYAAVPLSLLPEHAGGGLLQVGTKVDVWLTTRISPPKEFVEDEKKVTFNEATAQIARNVPIIAKRNSLFVVMAPVQMEQVTNYTLGANLYRAQLIHFAQTKGQISIVPTSSRPLGVVGRFGDDSSMEYRNEDERVEKVKRGELVVGYADLERLFQAQLPMIVTPPPSHKIELVSGVEAKKVAEFNIPSKQGVKNGDRTTIRGAPPRRNNTGMLMAEGNSGIIPTLEGPPLPESTTNYRGYVFEPPAQSKR